MPDVNSRKFSQTQDDSDIPWKPHVDLTMTSQESLAQSWGQQWGRRKRRISVPVQIQEGRIGAHREEALRKESGKAWGVLEGAQPSFWSRPFGDDSPHYHRSLVSALPFLL